MSVKTLTDILEVIGHAEKVYGAAGAGGTDALRRALLIGFANRLARRMAQHNGYKTLNEHSTLAQLHPSTAPLAADEYGLTPEYLIYTSLVATARIFLSKVGTHCHACRPVCTSWQ